MVIIMICIVGFFLTLYILDRNKRKNAITVSGGMKSVFGQYLNIITQNFQVTEVSYKGENKMYIRVSTKLNTTLYFGIKLGWNNNATYTCDSLPTVGVESKVMVHGSVLNQPASYELVVLEAKKSYGDI